MVKEFLNENKIRLILSGEVLVKKTANITQLASLLKNRKKSETYKSDHAEKPVNSVNKKQIHHEVINTINYDENFIDENNTGATKTTLLHSKALYANQFS